MSKKIDFKALIQSLTDIIQEEQIKLGYQKEVIRLYYPAQSVNHLLDTDLDSESLLRILEDLPAACEQTLGPVSATQKNDRFCFLIPQEGVTYVHEHTEERTFLKDFIGKISDGHCTFEELKEVFAAYSDDYSCEKAEHGEFDYLLWFNQGIPDSYLYCIKFEEHHAIYHRFTKQDYEDFDF